MLFLVHVLALSLLCTTDGYAGPVLAARADRTPAAGTAHETTASGIVYDFDYDAWQRTTSDSLREAQVKAVFRGLPDVRGNGCEPRGADFRNGTAVGGVA